MVAERMDERTDGWTDERSNDEGKGVVDDDDYDDDDDDDVAADDDGPA